MPLYQQIALVTLHMDHNFFCDTPKELLKATVDEEIYAKNADAFDSSTWRDAVAFAKAATLGRYDGQQVIMTPEDAVKMVSTQGEERLEWWLRYYAVSTEHADKVRSWLSPMRIGFDEAMELLPIGSSVLCLSPNNGVIDRSVLIVDEFSNVTGSILFRVKIHNGVVLSGSANMNIFPRNRVNVFRADPITGQVLQDLGNRIVRYIPMGNIHHDDYWNDEGQRVYDDNANPISLPG